MGALQGPVICPIVSVKNEIIVSVFPLIVAPANASVISKAGSGISIKNLQGKNLYIKLVEIF